MPCLQWGILHSPWVIVVAFACTRWRKQRSCGDQVIMIPNNWITKDRGKVADFVKYSSLSEILCVSGFQSVHYSSCDWGRTGRKKISRCRWDWNHNNNRTLFIHKYAVIIWMKTILIMFDIMLFVLLSFLLFSILSGPLWLLVGRSHLTCAWVWSL